MQEQAELSTVKDILFTLKDITYTPETLRLKQPFTVKGKIELFKIPFLAPIWVQVRVTYPEAWWEEIIPVIGSPTITEGAMVIGGDFEVTFPRGFDREGEFILEVNAYAGPTYSIDTMTLPPFPPVASEKTTFIIAGEVPPEEVGFRSFRILSYARNGGPPVTPPGVLELDVGDRCRVNVSLDHMDGAVTGKFHAAIWQERPWDPHDEVLNADKSFSVPSSVDWQPFTDYIDIIITSAISPGTEYGLYVKIMGITGGDIFTEYLANVITIVGIPLEEADIADFDFKLTRGTYDIGVKVPFTAPYKYKGTAQDGQLTIVIGTGVYPTFSPVYTYAPIPVRFGASLDWILGGIEGTITLPDVLEAGQTYSTRAKLEALQAKTQETDTDWGVITIRLGLPPSDLHLPTPGFEATPGTYDPGDRVPWAMVYQYKGKAQGGYLTISLGTGTYPSFFTKYTFPRVAVGFEEAIDWTSSRLTGNFTLPTTLELGQTYSVRAKLETADGVRETDTDWGVITITEAPPVVPPKADIADFDFRAEGGTYAIGDRVPFSASYKYQGKRQSGQLVLELGTGVYPTFYSRVIYSPMAVAFEEAMDWESRRLEGTFLLTEGLEPGQTYSMRAKLETLVDRTQETDTDWGVIAIKEVLPPPGEYTLTVWVSPMAAGWVTKEPDKSRYSYGEIVRLTAHSAPGYSFQSWWVGDEFLSSGNQINFMVLSDRTITAYFL